MRNVTELARWEFAGTLTGRHRRFGIGPVVAEVVVTQGVREDGVVCRPSFSVRYDGEHVFGGFAEHLPADAGRVLDGQVAFVRQLAGRREAAQLVVDTVYAGPGVRRVLVSREIDDPREVPPVELDELVVAHFEAAEQDGWEAHGLVYEFVHGAALDAARRAIAAGVFGLAGFDVNVRMSHAGAAL